jgi:hypothetical protein
MINSIIAVIFFVSIGGIAFMLAKKAPVLCTLPKNGGTGFRETKIILCVEERIKDFLIYFKKQIYLHKILSFVKVTAIKIETKVDGIMHGIRKNAQKIDKEKK